MIWLVMGVTGCGKTTLGRILAERLKIPFYDADDFHPPNNRAKLLRDEPLTDVDRQPWLESLADKMPEWEKVGGAVLACSALKEAYRKVLAGSGAPMKVIWLEISAEEVGRRLGSRKHDLVGKFHKILAGQFRDLEKPKNAVVVDAKLPNRVQIEVILAPKNA
ncbi:MAG: gluconokinase [Verrucomicrobia bacterium]|nr:gluconokinase [Verrucomicrobiota bacterium]